MKRYNDRETWEMIIEKENIIKRHNAGETLSNMQAEIIEKYGLDIENKYDGKALSKAIRRCGYIKQNNKFKSNAEIEFDKLLESIDIEETIEVIADKRYYDCYGLSYFYRKKRNTVEIEIDKNIFEEYKLIANKIGCDFDTEYLTAVLLEHLEEKFYVDRREEFALKAMEENENYTEEEIEFVLEMQNEGYKADSLMYLLEDYNIEEIRNMPKDSLEFYKELER